MNHSIIRYIVGMTLILEGALMAPSCIVAVIYGEPALWALAVSVLACVVLPHIDEMHLQLRETVGTGCGSARAIRHVRRDVRVIRHVRRDDRAICCVCRAVCAVRPVC